jgi:hypothetical protein
VCQPYKTLCPQRCTIQGGSSVQGLSAAFEVASIGLHCGATDKRYSLELPEQLPYQRTNEMTSTADSNRRLIRVLDRYAFTGAVVLALVLGVVYFLLPDSLPKERREFMSALITNFIPVLLVFAGSYLLFGEAQKIREEDAQKGLVADMSNATKIALGDQFDLIAQKVDATSRLIHDWDEKGVERVCSGAEIASVSAQEIQETDSLKVIGIGNAWLLKGEQYSRLLQLLERGKSAQVLIPDPLAPQIRERYASDEGEGAELDPRDFARLVLRWKNEMRIHAGLKVRAYHRYPMMNVSVYSNRVLASPILYRRRGKEGLTFVFRRPSIGADIYEGHFDKVFESGSNEIDDAYLERLRLEFHLNPAGA